VNILPGTLLAPKSVCYSSGKIYAGQGDGLNNTGRIAIDDNVIHKFNQREYIGLELTED
jgi:hypothetical protein